MNYSVIKEYDIANGPGCRTTLFVSGCRNRCEGCFQAETWSFSYGQPYTEETRQYLLDSMEPDYVAGLTLLGGDPFEEENQEVLVSLLEAVRERYGEKKSIWAYTGYVWEKDLVPGGRKYVSAGGIPASEGGRRPELFCTVQTDGNPEGHSATCRKDTSPVHGITDRMLACLDVLVDGPFVLAQKNISLQFRGSSNQRILDMPRTLEAGEPVRAEGYC